MPDELVRHVHPARNFTFTIDMQVILNKEELSSPKVDVIESRMVLHLCGDHRTHVCRSGDDLAEKSLEVSELQCGGATGAARGVSRPPTYAATYRKQQMPPCTLRIEACRAQS
jgi:hypothetical protein